MANEPSSLGLIVLTGMTIAAVVGLYAYDAVPRRDGVAPTTQISWPRWQSDDAPVQQSPEPPAPAYSQPQQPEQQSYPPSEQGYGQNPPPQYPQDQRGQDVPYDQQESQGGAGQPPPPDSAPRS